MPDGAVFFEFDQYNHGEWEAAHSEVIEEGFVTVYVNGSELATLMCTPRDPAQLVLGFLANEEIIQTLAEVKVLYVCPAEGCVDIWLSHPLQIQSRHRIITSGCGGGLTFNDLASLEEPVDSQVTIHPERLGELMVQLQSQGNLYARARGVHTSALSDGARIVLVAEDIGRHNTLDRLRGECLRQGLDPAGMILLATGRISSEMMTKAAKMGCPVVASRTSPTSLSVDLAHAWNITLCGYVRRKSLNVYAHPERLAGARQGAEQPGFLVVWADS